METNSYGISQSRIAQIRKQIENYERRLGANSNQSNTSIGRVTQLSGAGASNNRFGVRPNFPGPTRPVSSNPPPQNHTTENPQSPRSNIRTRFGDRGGVRFDDISYFDKNKDGEVSDQEALAYLVKLRKANRTSGISGLARYNENTNALNSYLSMVDQNQDGNLSNLEVVEARLAANYENIDENIRDLVLNLNAKRNLIEEAISMVDVSGDNQISDIEALNALVHLRKGTFGGEEGEVVRSVVESNDNHDLIEDDLDLVDGDDNGNISRDEIWATLRLARQEEISTSRLERLRPIMELNPDFEAILEEFNNSIEGKYSNAQLYDAQAHITKRLQEAQMRSHNTAGALADRSMQMLLEELASIYGDEYLSENESSPDFYKMNGISGEVQDRLIAEGYDMDTIINGTANVEDIQKMNDILLEIINREDIEEAVDHFDSQHKIIQNYINRLKVDLLKPLNTSEKPSLAVVLEDFAYAYGDFGFAGDPDGFSGFTGAIAAGLNNQDILNTEDPISLSAIQQMQVIIAGVLGEEIDQSTFVEDNLALLSRSGKLDILSAATGDPTDNKNINALLIARYVEEGLRGDELFAGLSLELNADEKTAALEHLAGLVSRSDLDVDTDGVMNSSDMELIIKYMNGVRGEDLTNTLITDENNYSMTSYLETSKQIEEYYEQSFLGAILPDYSNPGVPFSAANLVQEIAMKFGDSYSEIDGMVIATGIAKDMRDALTEFGIDVNDKSKELSRFDMQFIANKFKEMTGLDLGLGINNEKHEQAHDLIASTIENFGTEDAQSFEDFMSAIAEIYGDSLDFSDRNTFQGFSAVAALSIENLFENNTDSMTLEALNTLKNNYEGLLNPQEIPEDLLPKMNNFNETTSFIKNSMEKLAAGGSLGTLTEFFNEIASIWGDEQDPDYTGFTGELYTRFDTEGLLNLNQEIGQQGLELVLDEISSQTNNYNFVDPRENSVTQKINAMQNIQHMLFDRMNEAAFKVPTLETGRVPTLASSLAEVREMVDNEFIYEAFEEMLAKEGYNLTDDVHEADYAALNMIYGAINRLFGFYVDQGMVDNIEPVVHDRLDRFSGPTFLNANTLGGVNPMDVLSIVNFLNDPERGHGVRPGDPAWDPRKDTNKDGLIDESDSELVTAYLNSEQS